MLLCQQRKKNVVIVCFLHGSSDNGEDFRPMKLSKRCKTERDTRGFMVKKNLRSWRKEKHKSHHGWLGIVDKVLVSHSITLLCWKKLKLLFCLLSSFRKYFTLSWYHCFLHSLCVGVLEIYMWMWCDVMETSWEMSSSAGGKSRFMRRLQSDTFCENFQHNVTFHRQRAPHQLCSYKQREFLWVSEAMTAWHNTTTCMNLCN